MPPFDAQHYEFFPDLDDWIWVDYYVYHPKIQNWDATTLEEIPETSCEEIYASHLLEHFPHPKLRAILKVWYSRLIEGGALTINVPDMRWAAEQIIRYENKQPINSRHYHEWEGEHGLQQIIYGSHAHPGEVHKSGFTESSLRELLEETGFEKIDIDSFVDAHDMGILLARCRK